ncbi:hypothetical protein JHK87_018095 [Glycine soja]|nr:hypothetical protein JHK87_018095 [Glycine soja]
MKDVFLHIKLMEQASESDQPTIFTQEECDYEVQGSALRLTFACNSSVRCLRMQIFEKKGFTLGVVLLVVQSGHDKLVRIRVESTLMFAMKRPKTGAMKLPFGLCGCQEENSKGGELVEIEEETSDGYRGKEFQDSGQRIQLQVPLPSSSFVVLVDEWQTIKSGGDEIEKLLLNLRSLINQEQSMPIVVELGKDFGTEETTLEKTIAPGKVKSQNYVSHSVVGLRCKVRPLSCFRNPYLKDGSDKDLDPFGNQRLKCAANKLIFANQLQQQKVINNEISTCESCSSVSSTLKETIVGAASGA